MMSFGYDKPIEFIREFINSGLPLNKFFELNSPIYYDEEKVTYHQLKNRIEKASYRVNKKAYRLNVVDEEKDAHWFPNLRYGDSWTGAHSDMRKHKTLWLDMLHRLEKAMDEEQVLDLEKRKINELTVAEFRQLMKEILLQK